MKTKGISRQDAVESILHEKIKRKHRNLDNVQTALGWLFVIGISALFGYRMGMAF